MFSHFKIDILNIFWISTPCTFSHFSWYLQLTLAIESQFCKHVVITEMYNSLSNMYLKSGRCYHLVNNAYLIIKNTFIIHWTDKVFKFSLFNSSIEFHKYALSSTCVAWRKYINKKWLPCSALHITLYGPWLLLTQGHTRL